MSEPTPRPFLKWAGGKRRLLPEIMALFPANGCNRYIEPFVGGGAVFFEAARLGLFDSAVIADVNPHLCSAYEGVKKAPDRLIRWYDTCGQGENDYYRVRDDLNLIGTLGMRSLAMATYFVYLNRLGFNGLCRYNRRGEFNVPWGKRKRRVAIDIENLHACSRALQRAEIVCDDFINVIADAGEGDVIYADPPYFPLPGKRSFVSYFGAFGVDEQRMLAYALASAANRGATVIASNSWVDEAVELYRGLGFDVSRVECARQINCRGDGRDKVGEMLAYRGS